MTPSCVSVRFVHPEDEATGVRGINGRIGTRVYICRNQVLIDFFIKRMAG